MRVFFSIVLITTFVLRPAIEMSTMMYYQLNIDDIVEKYCVNKDRPSLNCNGKCYLMSQMKANTQSSKEKSETIVISEIFVPLYFEENTIKLSDTYTNITITHHWKFKNLLAKEVLKAIDYPPECVLS